MRASDLEAVREASKRERSHVVGMCREPGCTIVHSCYCDGCRADREIIAAAAPWLLDCVREGRAMHRSAGTTSGEME